MFPSPSEISGHTFLSDEYAAKWKGIFINALRGVQRQVHPGLSAKDDALEYIEQLMMQLLVTLCHSQPHTVQDVEDRVQKTFPHPIDKWAIRDAQGALEKGKKNSSLVLPVDKVHPLLKQLLGHKVDYQVALYIVAVLEYIAADILKFTGIYVKNIRHNEITSQDIKVAICADQVLMDMFSQEEDTMALTVEDEPVHRESTTYEEIVKDFIVEETQYMRDLNMIIKVFRAPFVELFPRSKDLDVIFSNIIDVYEFTAKLLSSVEDQVEVADPKESPTVGTSFEDVAEGEEFSVYDKYVDDMLAPHGRERLNTLLLRKDVNESLLGSAGQALRDATKYVLPKLLLGPVYHCFHYFEVLKALIEKSPTSEDRESLEQANGLLQALKASLERKLSGSVHKRKPWEISLRLTSQVGRTAVLKKMTEVQKSIDGWEGKDIWQSCSEFIMEGKLSKYTGRHRSERHVFLFDGLIILCKQNVRRSSVTGPIGEFKLKEKFFVRKIDIIDKEDTDEVKHAFDIQLRGHPGSALGLIAKTSEEKGNWMAALISLQTRSNLERILDGIIRAEDKKHPLRLPPPDKYRFAVEDSDDNIVFEENQDPTVESPVIKGGLLHKLIERLTYHMYADPKFVRTFLTTYRSICSPHELLDLLIERFNIPDPCMDDIVSDDGIQVSLRIQEDLRRFRKEYVKPVQFRVVNVLRHWFDHHFYDFERDKSLLEKLIDFLNSVKGKAMRKMAESIITVIKRRCESAGTEREFTYQKQPPTIEWHIVRKTEDYDLMTLHPIEIARQVTLCEFELYRAVQPSELVEGAWVKKNKVVEALNLLKMISFSTMFTFWMEKCIVETENLEERAAVVSRILEIMLVFQELNNFNGVLEVVVALNSASVHRLEHTYKEINHKLLKALDDAKELNSDHFRRYQEKLRSINPPCVPFLGVGLSDRSFMVDPLSYFLFQPVFHDWCNKGCGMYLTNILLTDEGNPDFLPNRPPGLINFSKRRKIAEIIAEIQQYQNQPYCLTVEHSIKEFFEKLNPLDSMTEKEFNDYIYNKSLEIEPRNAKQLPKFPKKFEYSLKSPGIKPMANRHSASSRSHPLAFGFTKSPDNDDTTSQPAATPPTTPCSPLTPPHSSGGSSNNVFTAEQSQMPPQRLSTSSLSSSIPSNIPEELEECKLKAPPLPPRQRNWDSYTEPVRSLSVPEPPPPPPRQDWDRPPPVPPRRDSVRDTGHCNTLPRSQSVSHPRPPAHPLNSATLPRHHSERFSSERNFQSASMMDLNGDDGYTPELPPRTYKYSHSDKYSS